MRDITFGVIVIYSDLSKKQKVLNVEGKNLLNFRMILLWLGDLDCFLISLLSLGQIIFLAISLLLAKSNNESESVSRSVVSDSATLWTVACQDPLSMGFSRQKYWNGLPCTPPGELPPDLGIEPTSPASKADTLPTEPLGKSPT